MDYKTIPDSVRENQNELHHHGIPGMKWGGRKNKYAITTSDPIKKKYLTTVKKEARAMSKKDHPIATLIGTRRSKQYQQRLGKALLKTYKKDDIEDNALKTEYENHKGFKKVANKMKSKYGDYYSLLENSHDRLNYFDMIAGKVKTRNSTLGEEYDHKSFVNYDKQVRRAKNVINSIQY